MYVNFVKNMDWVPGPDSPICPKEFEVPIVLTVLFTRQRLFNQLSSMDQVLVEAASIGR